jgi:hypothetical protein
VKISAEKNMQRPHIPQIQSFAQNQKGNFRKNSEEKMVPVSACAPSPAPGVDMTVIGNLAHHVIDKKAIRPPLRASHCRQHLDHQAFLGFARRGPMLAQDSHWGITGVTIQDRELERINKLAVALRVVTQLTKVASVHYRSTPSQRTVFD